MRTTHVAAFACFLALAACTVDDTPAEPPDAPRFDPLPASAAIAFVSNRDGAPALYVANADGSGVVRIGSGGDPAWSPDGRRLAFADDGIGVIEEDGSRRGLAGGRSFAPAWSPDGTQLLYNSYTFTGTDDGIFVVNADGSGARRIIPNDVLGEETGVGRPAWSPDGKTIAFVGFSGETWGAMGIFLVDADGSDPRPLYYGSDPAWSPDGARLVITWSNIVIWTVGADGTGAEAWGKGFSPSWMPDGRSILFSEYSSPPTDASPYRSRQRIFIRTGAGSTPYQLFPDAPNPALPDYDDGDAVWRPGR
jgi:Tol biopolymer transport system component